MDQGELRVGGQGRHLRCASAPSGVGKRLQRAVLEQTKAKLRVRVRKPDADAEICDGSDDLAALEAAEADPAAGQRPSSDAAALKARRAADEATLRSRTDALLPGIGQVLDEARRRDDAGRLLKLKQAATRLSALSDAAAVEAIGAMLAKVAAQQAQLDAARQTQAGRALVRKPAGRRHAPAIFPIRSSPRR